jgi:hypothetical protein
MTLPDEEDLIVPGMKRHLYLDRNGGGENDNGTVDDQRQQQQQLSVDDDSASLKMQQPLSRQLSRQSSIDVTSNGHQGRDLSAVTNAVGFLSKTNPMSQMTRY